MFGVLHKNRKISRDDFRARSKTRFDFLHHKKNKSDKLLVHEALSFKKPKK